MNARRQQPFINKAKSQDPNHRGRYVRHLSCVFLHHHAPIINKEHRYDRNKKKLFYFPLSNQQQKWHWRIRGSNIRILGNAQIKLISFHAPPIIKKKEAEELKKLRVNLFSVLVSLTFSSNQMNSNLSASLHLISHITHQLFPSSWTAATVLKIRNNRWMS